MALARKKILEYFDATTVKEPIHIIGCGAVGSHIAEQLARIGCSGIELYDFDIVEPHNITNQMFVQEDIGELKVDAVARQILAINPDCIVKKHPKGIEKPYHIGRGYVFLCVDNIDLRREICKANRYNTHILAMFDFRMRLTDAQHYFANWHDREQIDSFIAGMEFSHDEAKESTPTSACGTELSVVYTVKVITSVGIHNFITFVQSNEAQPIVLVDMKHLSIDCI